MILQVINVYKCNDGRYRAYCRDENGQPKIVSYPRILMEQSLGRPLELFEDIHHINGDASDNVLDNLTIIEHGRHQRLHAKKYFDKVAICDVCGKAFIWTAKRQSAYFRDIKRKKNRISKKYEEYHYIKVGNITLQILPSKTPEKYTKDKLKIQNQTIDYYKISKKNKIGLIYGTNIKTGNTDYYVYDTEEETLSRYYNPEVKLYQKELKQLKEYTMIVIGVIAFLSIIVIICSLQKGKKKKHLKTM